MALSSDFINAVDSHDNMMTRIMLEDSMLVDLTLKQFEERLAYAESRMSDLYDDHDGEEFPSDVTRWNEELLDRQMVAVVGNFSKERVAFLKKLVRNIYAQKAEEADQEEFVEQHKPENNVAVAAGVGVAACGTVAAVVGLITSHPVVAVAGVAAVAVGGVIIVKGK